MFKEFVVIFAIFFLLLNTISSQPLTVENSVQTEVYKIANDKVMKNGRIGVCVKSLQTGKTILSENALKNMAPASNLKLMTTAAALGVLGETYTFKTYIEYDGEIKDSVLYGNLYIRGTGDPTLGSDRFKGFPQWDELIEIWSKKIKDYGLKKIEGAIVGDASIFDWNSIPDNWPWGDIGNYYGAGIYGLNINENSYRVYFKGSAVGDSAKLVKTVPDLSGYTIYNQVKTAVSGSGDKAYIYAAPFSNTIFMKGTIPLGSDLFSVRGSIPNPPLLSAALLKKSLELKNVKVERKADVLLGNKLNNQNRKIIAVYESPKLSEIVKQTNVNSVNLFAEVLLKMCGQKINGDASMESGIKAVQEYWKLKGLDITGWFMFDGSGLSPNNGISPSQMCQAMYLISKDTVFNAFYSSFPIAGQTGTVYKIGKGTVAEGNVRVKSGTLSKVICYSGYFASKSGEKFSFSIMTNNYDCSNATIISKLEKLLIKMAEMP